MEKYLQEIDRVIAQGPYDATWESLSEYKEPKWFRDGKFGIFIHWGVYSVPAFGSEWYSRNMYIQGSKEYEHHIATYGKHTEFGYKDFIPMFKAEKWDPQKWADLFARAGAKYVVPVAEHHDGFQMYKSDISHWNAYEMGPHRDVLGELSKACREHGMVNGASTHRVEHWFFMSHGKDFPSDIHEPMQRGDFYWPAMQEGDHFDIFSEPTPTEEYLNDWMTRTCEIIDRYHPKELYFDWWIQHSAVRPYLKKIAAYYYNRAAEWGEEVMIAYKHDSFVFGTAVPDVERGYFAELKHFAWQTDTAIALNSWCYTENNDFRPAEDLVRDLVDIVSKNGSLLLNVGPKADGTISEEDTAVLEAIGAWMQVNGEAIYGTRPWRKFGEGPTKIEEGQFTDGIRKNYTEHDFRFTRKGENVYVFCMKCTESGDYCVVSLGTQDASHKPNFHGIITDIELLGSDEKVEFYRDEEGLHLHTDMKSDMPIVFKLTVT